MQVSFLRFVLDSVLSHRLDLTSYGRPPMVCNSIAWQRSLLRSSSFVCIANKTWKKHDKKIGFHGFVICLIRQAYLQNIQKNIIER